MQASGTVGALRKEVFPMSLLEAKQYSRRLVPHFLENQSEKDFHISSSHSGLGGVGSRR
jgi:hypothetical protein